MLNADVLELKEAKNHFSLEYDLFGFGSGVYFGKLDKGLFDFVDKLPETTKKAFVFSTRGRNSLFQNSYHKALREKLNHKGYRVVAEFSCRGFSDYHKIFKLFGGVNKGHPNKKDLEKAKMFVQQLKRIVL